MKKLVFTLLFFTFAIQSFSQTDWVVQNSSPQINKIDFIDSKIGWAVGLNGVILKTLNGGNTWIPQRSGTSTNLNSVFFLDINIGWVVGDDETILKTLNGGTTWIIQTSGVTSLKIYEIQFFNTNNGLAIGENGKILNTIDGGSTWINQSSGIISDLFDLTYIDINNILVVGEGRKILKSINGGLNWNTLNTPPLPFGTSEILISMDFINSNIGCVAGDNGTILRTENGGSTWFRMNTGTISKIVFLQYIDLNKIQAITFDGKLLTSSNGGADWLQQNLGITDIKNVLRIDSTNFFVINNTLKIYNTLNGGVDWKLQILGQNHDLSGVDFINKDKGWAVGANGTILHTSNGGSSWNPQVSGTINYLTSVSFVDADNGWCVGHSGIILHTNNGGLTWSQQSYVAPGGFSTLNAVYFYNINLGFAVGNSSTILFTEDGGVTWSHNRLPNTSISLFGITPIGNNEIFAVGSNGIVVNIGAYIPQVGSYAASTIEGAGSIYDASKGFYVGSNKKIIRNGTGGAVLQSGPQSGTYEGVDFLDNSIGWVIGSGGSIVHTTNGGSDWNEQASGTLNHLRGISAIDENNIWVVGDNGIILKNKCQVNGRVMQLDGNTQAIDISNVGNFNINGTTFESWIKPTSISNNHVIFSRGTSTSGIILGVSNQSGIYKIWISLRSGNSWVNQYFSTISLNTWTHISLVFSMNKIYILKNGIEVGSITSSFTLNGTNFNTFIGRNHYLSSQFFGGQIDDIRIWNVAKTSSHILQSKDKNLLGIETNLLAYYDLNLSSSSNIENRVNSKNNGIGINFPKYVDSPTSPVLFPEVSNNLDLEECQIFKLNGSFGKSYLWTGPNNFSTTNNFFQINSSNPNMSGEYKLRVEDYVGCRTFASKSVYVGVDPLQNTIFKNGIETTTQVYSAKSSITSPAEGQTNIINNSAKTTYQAGNAIFLNPGFTTNTGGIFKAEIKTCN